MTSTLTVVAVKIHNGASLEELLDGFRMATSPDPDVRERTVRFLRVEFLTLGDRAVDGLGSSLEACVVGLEQPAVELGGNYITLTLRRGQQKYKGEYDLACLSGELHAIE